MSESLLAQLDSMPQIRAFDAFPKTHQTYTTRSSRGGVFTILVSALIIYLAWYEMGAYFYGHPTTSFGVDHSMASEMQVNVDVTVNMKCHYLTVDVRDAVGDRLHFSDSDITKDETSFDIGHASRLDSIPMPDRHIGDLVDAARHMHMPTFSRKSKPKRKAKGYGGRHVAFAPTEHIVPSGDACRIYGSVILKKVTSNLHISTLGHGYFSFEHTPHNIMNLSHVVHELSFGPYFPDIAQPLDHSVEITNDHFSIFQYFVNIVPTRYIDGGGREVTTNQYSVHDYVRTVQHGMGVPGIFVKFDVEPLTLTLRQRTATLTQFLVRLAGILGGVWVCAGYTLRAGDRAVRTAAKIYRGGEGEDGFGGDTADHYAFTSAYSSRNRSGSRGVGGGPAWKGMARSHSSRFSYSEIYNPSPQGSRRGTTSTVAPGAASGDGGFGDASMMSSASDASLASVSATFTAAREKAGQAWQAALGGVGGPNRHRKNESLATKIMSEEGRGGL